VHGHDSEFLILCDFDFMPYVSRDEILSSFESQSDYIKEPFMVFMSLMTDHDFCVQSSLEGGFVDFTGLFDNGVVPLMFFTVSSVL
jgi:hypothetical protein